MKIKANAYKNVYFQALKIDEFFTHDNNPTLFVKTSDTTAQKAGVPHDDDHFFGPSKRVNWIRIEEVRV